MTTRKSSTKTPAPKADIYTRITETILAQLEQGTCPWAKPWNAEHLAGRITRPLRAGGKPYRGINVVMLWVAATLKGSSAPIWMTYRQAAELGSIESWWRIAELGALVIREAGMERAALIVERQSDAYRPQRGQLVPHQAARRESAR